MPYCRECGTSLDAAVKFCPNCGAAQQANLVESVAAAASMRSRLPESRVVAIFTVLTAITGFAMLGVGLLITGTVEASIRTFAIWFGSFVAAVGVLSLMTAYGILRKMSWARLTGWASGLTYIVTGVLVLGGSTIGGLLSLAFGAGSVYIFTRGDTKKHLKGVTP